MGMPLYQQQPPTGYKDTAEAWVSTGGLLARLNFALDLAAGRVARRRVRASALRAGRRRRRARRLASPPGSFPRAVSDSHPLDAGARDDRPRPSAHGGPDPRLARVPEEMSHARIATRLPEVVRAWPSSSFGALPALLSPRGPTPRTARGGARRWWSSSSAARATASTSSSPTASAPTARLRPTIAIPAPNGGSEDAALDLDGFFGLHPRPRAARSRSGSDGSLAVVHAVGSPDPTRSHFDAQDFMESGTPGRKATEDGWMNRCLQAQRRRAGHAVPRRGHDPEPAPLAARHGPGASRCRSIREFGLRAGGGRRGRPRLRGHVRRRRADALHGTARRPSRPIRFLKKADPARYPPGAGAEYPRGRSARPQADRAAHQGRRRPRAGLHRDRRLGPPRGRGRRHGPAAPTGCASWARPWRPFTSDLGDRMRDVVRRDPDRVRPHRRARTATAAPTTATPASSFVMGGPVARRQGPRPLAGPRRRPALRGPRPGGHHRLPRPPRRAARRATSARGPGRRCSPATPRARKFPA